jgi:hypothetical protein
MPALPLLPEIKLKSAAQLAKGSKLKLRTRRESY